MESKSKSEEQESERKKKCTCLFSLPLASENNTNRTIVHPSRISGLFSFLSTPAPAGAKLYSLRVLSSEGHGDRLLKKPGREKEEEVKTRRQWTPTTHAEAAAARADSEEGLVGPDKTLDAAAAAVPVAITATTTPTAANARQNQNPAPSSTAAAPPPSVPAYPGAAAMARAHANAPDRTFLG